MKTVKSRRCRRCRPARRRRGGACRGGRWPGRRRCRRSRARRRRVPSRAWLPAAGSAGPCRAPLGPPQASGVRRHVTQALGSEDAAWTGCGVFLPSGLSPSVVEFHHINRTLAAIRVADCHRRFGLAPTPEHARAVQLVERQRTRHRNLGRLTTLRWSHGEKFGAVYRTTPSRASTVRATRAGAYAVVAVDGERGVRPRRRRRPARAARRGRRRARPGPRPARRRRSARCRAGPPRARRASRSWAATSRSGDHIQSER